MTYQIMEKETIKRSVEGLAVQPIMTVTHGYLTEYPRHSPTPLVIPWSMSYSDSINSRRFLPYKSHLGSSFVCGHLLYYSTL